MTARLTSSGIGLADKPAADLSEVRRVLVDQRSGRPLVETRRRRPVLSKRSGIFTPAFSPGPQGNSFSALISICFLASLVSGVVLYGPFASGRPFGDVRTKADVSRWLDLHNVVGVVLAAWMIVVGATGLMNALERPLFGAWQAETMPRLLAPYQGKPFPKSLSSVDAALVSATDAARGMVPTSIGFPYSPYGSPRHYLIWLKGKTHLTQRFFTTVLVDAADGHLAAIAPLPWYLRILEISRPLHFGDYGGLPLRSSGRSSISAPSSFSSPASISGSPARSRKKARHPPFENRPWGSSLTRLLGPREGIDISNRAKSDRALGVREAVALRSVCP